MRPRQRQRKPASLPQGTVEYAVDRATLMKFFRPPVSESTFYKLQQDVYIVPVEGCPAATGSTFRWHASASTRSPTFPPARIRERIVDLLPIARRRYYHPDFVSDNATSGPIAP